MSALTRSQTRGFAWSKQVDNEPSVISQRKSMSSSNKTTAIALIALVVAGGGGWWYMHKPPASTAAAGAPAAGAPAAGAPGAGAPGAGAPGGAPPGPPRAMGVEIAVVQSSSLRDDAQTIGTLKSRQNTMVRPEVAGRVVALGFTDGSQVKAGQMLVQLEVQSSQ